MFFIGCDRRTGIVVSLILAVACFGVFVMSDVLSVPSISSVTPNSGPAAGGNTIQIAGSGFQSSSQGGDIDPSFLYDRGANNRVYAIALQSDQKILVGGQFGEYDGEDAERIARLNSNGTIDTSFDTRDGFNRNVLDIAVQPDGKILVVGEFRRFDGDPINRIARLNSDGSLDTSFDPGDGANNNIESVALQSDGKIIIGGSFYEFDNQVSPNIARLNQDGSFDPTFDVKITPWTGGFNSTVWDVEVDASDRIYAGGVFSSFMNTPSNRIARLTPSGVYDATFAIGSGFNNGVRDIEIDASGKAVVVGYFNSYNSSSLGYVARLNTNGTLDTSFNPGSGAASGIEDVAIDSAGRILAVGSFYSFDGNVSPSIARLLPNGGFDASFNVLINPWNGGLNNTGLEVVAQPDNKVLVGGQFNRYKGVRRNRLVRILSDSSPVEVTIGSTPCGSVTVISDTLLECVAPPGMPGFVDVTITDSSYISATLVDGYLYESPPFLLSFSIRDELDNTTINTCDLGEASPSAMSQCRYRLRINTNSSQGYSVFVRVDGNLNSEDHAIDNALDGFNGGSEISASTIGVEKYGIIVYPGNATGGTPTVAGAYTAGLNSVRLANLTDQQLLSADGPNQPATPSFSNTVLIEHRLNISPQTPPGNYNQRVIYSVVPNF